MVTRWDRFPRFGAPDYISIGSFILVFLVSGNCDSTFPLVLISAQLVIHLILYITCFNFGMLFFPHWWQHHIFMGNNLDVYHFVCAYV